MDFGDLSIALIRSLFVSLPFVAALLLGVGIPAAIVVTSTLTAKLSPNSRALLIVGALVLGSALSVAFSGRTLYSSLEISRDPSLARWAQGPSVIGIRFSQTFTLIALLVSIGEIFRWVTGRLKVDSGVGKLLLSLVIFNGISVGLAGLVGEFREPELRDLYFFIVISGLAVVAAEIQVSFWRVLRWLLVVPLAGSLVAAAIAPQLVWLNDYQSFIPGLSSRLFGLSEHANGLGMLAAVAIAIECSTLVRARPSALMLVLQLAVLILSQSKTAWLALFAVLPLVRWHWLTSHQGAADPWSRQVRLLLVLIGVTMALSLLVTVAAGSSEVRRFLEDNKVYTLTGRFTLWAITLDEFVKSPLLGYGPSIWDVQYRMERGLVFAGQAHNQFVQILGQAGALGLLSMLVYLTVLGRLAVRARVVDHGLAMGLFVLLLIRCLSESPLRMAGIMSWDSLLHVLVWVAAARYGSRTESRQSSVWFGMGRRRQGAMGAVHSPRP